VNLTTYLKAMDQILFFLNCLLMEMPPSE